MQARNYSIKRDSMSYFPLEYINSPPTDSSGIYVGWNWAFPSNLLQCQCRKRGLEEENQSRGGAGTAVRRNIDYTSNQCEMLTELLSRKSWQPNCISWALPVSRCYYSYMQINNLWAEIKRERGRLMARRKRLQRRLWIRVASIIINIKTLKFHFHSGTHRCFAFSRKKKIKQQIPLRQKNCLNFVLSSSSCSFKLWLSPLNLCLD